MACSLFEVFTIIRVALLCNFSKELALTLPQHVHTLSRCSRTGKIDVITVFSFSELVFYLVS